MYAAEHAGRFPDQPAIVMATGGEVVTYREYEDRANQVAQFFRSLGLRRLDHVAMFMENHPRLLEAQGGAERTGLYYTLVNSYLSAEEVAYLVNDSRAQVVVTSAAKRDIALRLPEQCPGVRRWLMVDDDDPPAPYESYAEVMAEFPITPVDGERVGAAMLYSSGTTGRPKGILRPLPDQPAAQPIGVMDFVKAMFNFREQQIYLSPAPLYHSAPQASVAATIRLGGTAVIMEHFDPAHYLELVARHRITHSQLVPSMFSRMLKLPDEVRAAADVSSLEAIIHAAAPCPVPVKQAMIEWWGPIILEYYGATEANGFTWCNSEQWLAHPGTVGKAVLGEVIIRDEEGKPLPTGEPGTIWFRGATNFTYWQDPEKTAESRDATGTESTVGDVGYLDDEGYLYLTDRKSYMIISGGVNIYPQETESLLVTHPKVFDAAVIGVPNEDLGEEVKAVVQLMPDVAAGPETERELIAFCREHLAHFKCPRSVDFVDELPRLPTGKLYKRLLRDQYWTGRSSSIV
jgi:long-chain acyl-CoA synthetase